jgi:hypothetical protein
MKTLSIWPLNSLAFFLMPARLLVCVQHVGVVYFFAEWMRSKYLWKSTQIKESIWHRSLRAQLADKEMLEV